MKKYSLFIFTGLIFATVIFAASPVPKKIRNIFLSDLSDSQVKVNWQVPNSQDTTYELKLKDENGHIIAKYSTGKKYYLITDLEEQTKYYIKIRAINDKKRGDWSIAKAITTRKKPVEEITTIFGGDVMMSRYVGRITASKNDWDLAFHNIASEFSQNDLAFANLEAPFKETGPYYVSDDSMTFKVDPKMIAGLQLAGVDIVSLANNHIGNAGQASIDYTKNYLADNGIAYCLDHYDIREVKGVKFGFLCYAYNLNLNEEQLKKDLAEIKDKADIIIVSMHNGAEYTENISTSQSNFAHTAIDNGADLVIGHHPHVVQKMEEYNGKYIFYSLGNLVFDQSWSWPTQLGAAVKITWENDIIKKIEFQPIKIDGDFQPRFMDFEEGKEVLERLQVDNYEIIK